MIKAKLLKKTLISLSLTLGVAVAGCKATSPNFSQEASISNKADSVSSDEDVLKSLSDIKSGKTKAFVVKGNSSIKGIIDLDNGKTEEVTYPPVLEKELLNALKEVNKTKGFAIKDFNEDLKYRVEVVSNIISAVPACDKYAPCKVTTGLVPYVVDLNIWLNKVEQDIAKRAANATKRAWRNYWNG